jgi:hypothetical protein
MIKVKLGESISKEQVIKDIESRFCDLKEVMDLGDLDFSYIVTGVRFSDVAGVGQELFQSYRGSPDSNDVLLDSIVEDGNYMGDISFEFAGFDEETKAVSIKVFVNDVSDWVEKILMEEENNV